MTDYWFPKTYSWELMTDAEYERNANLPYFWEVEPADPEPPAEWTAPLVRCAYCGVHDPALLTCPSCGGPRRWY